MEADLRVCFIGDSFVAGIGDPEHLGWVGRLATRTTSGGRRLTAYNLGVRAETSADVLSRCRRECAARLPAGCDGRVVVSFGVNDTVTLGGRSRVLPAVSADNLGILLRQLGDARWPALVVGPPAVDDEHHVERIRDLDGRFATVCESLDVGYVGLVDAVAAGAGWRREVADGDGAHPAAAGYRRIADLVWPAWTSWLAVG